MRPTAPNETDRDRAAAYTPDPSVTSARRSFRYFAPLDEGFEAVVVVGQGLGEGEELGDGVVRAGETHLDSIAVDRDAGRQAGESAVEGVHGNRDADPGASGLAEFGQHPVAAGFFVPEGGGLLEPPELAEQRGAGERADGAGPLGPEGPHQGGRPGARDAEERFEVAAGQERPVERVELVDGVGDGEEPPGVGGHLTDRSTRGGRESWDDDAAAYLTSCYETVVSNAKVASSLNQSNIKDVMLC